MREKAPVVRVLGPIVLAIGLIFALGPIYLALCSASVSNRQLIEHGVAFVPGTQFIANLAEVQRRADFGRLLLNSFLVASIVVVGKLLISALTAYAVVFFRSRIKHVIFAAVLVTLLLPLEVRVIPTYAVAADLLEPVRAVLSATGLDHALQTIASIRISIPTINLLNSYTGLSLPLVASATGTYLFRQFYRTIPAELLEAAKMDGAGPIRFFVDMLLPLSKANFSALGIIVFVSTWKDYMWPLVATNQQDMRTVVLGVVKFLPTDASQLPEWNLMMAATVVALAPPILVVALMQKWLVKGIIGAEK
ncbi:MAG: ABC transporter permease subunit [Paraburkholderia sp.]|uniref:ABC transporter permease subunit n=1 Tax=Paraburkholderia sp. TaxID=1926495 RepID=UPI001227D763|nr:ABC transporter permease subunit [Paraburkholderia sp.]TAM05321.1 MAG: ABC transporter permease subunit [Paraburkholderia sp.]